MEGNLNRDRHVHLVDRGVSFAGFRAMGFHEIHLALPFVCCDEQLASIAMR